MRSVEGLITEKLGECWVQVARYLCMAAVFVVSKRATDWFVYTFHAFVYKGIVLPIRSSYICCQVVLSAQAPLNRQNVAVS